MEACARHGGLAWPGIPLECGADKKLTESKGHYRPRYLEHRPVTKWGREGISTQLRTHLTLIALRTVYQQLSAAIKANLACQPFPEDWLEEGQSQLCLVCLHYK